MSFHFSYNMQPLATRYWSFTISQPFKSLIARIFHMEYSTITASNSNGQYRNLITHLPPPTVVHAATTVHLATVPRRTQHRLVGVLVLTRPELVRQPP